MKDKIRWSIEFTYCTCCGQYIQRNEQIGDQCVYCVEEED